MGGEWMFNDEKINVFYLKGLFYDYFCKNKQTNITYVYTRKSSSLLYI